MQHLKFSENCWKKVRWKFESSKKFESSRNSLFTRARAVYSKKEKFESSKKFKFSVQLKSLFATQVRALSDRRCPCECRGCSCDRSLARPRGGARSREWLLWRWSTPPFVDRNTCVQFYQFSIQLSTAEADAYHRFFRCYIEMYRGSSDKFALRHFVQLLGRSFLAPRSVGIWFS